MPVCETVRAWAAHETPMLSSGRYTLYRQTEWPGTVQRPSGTLGPAWVVDNYEGTTDLCGQVDHDPPEDRNLTVVWDLEMLRIDPGTVRDARVFVRVNGSGEYRFLGNPLWPHFSFFEWRTNSSLVAEPFHVGPEFGADYQFRVDIDAEEGTTRRVPTADVVRFRPVEVGSTRDH